LNRNRLIVLQAVGALSILPYPVVLVANIMSIAAPGHTTANSLPWILLSFYPLVWIGLYIFAWRAMARGNAGLAFGLSSIPALACALAFGIYVFSWIGFSLGMAGIGKGGLHSQTYSDNYLLNSISIATQEVQLPPGPAATMEKALRAIDVNPDLVNASIPGRGSPLNVALMSLVIGVDGTIHGDSQRQQDRIRLVRALVAHGAHLSADEAQDLYKTWVLRRALLDGPITTRSENPLVWRIVTHERADSKPFNALTDPLPPRRDGPAAFRLKTDEMPLVNRGTRLHGTPLYAALLDNAADVCSVIIRAGGSLSAEEERDPAAAAALEKVFERDGGLRLAYTRVR
jgi:hypothetical protein